MERTQSEHDRMLNVIGMQHAQLTQYEATIKQLETQIRELDERIRLLDDDYDSLDIDYRDALDKIDHLELQLATAKDQLVLERNRSWQQ
jgi:septal ring factor EnvC (AmiA/AmiB activator)